MTAHYQEFRLDDPAVIARVIMRWPFAAIVANGPEWPVVAHAPLVLSKAAGGREGFDAVEFHLAKINPALADLGDGIPVTLDVQGPSAHVSPAWYMGRFPNSDADRSRTAPTWDYLTLTMRGHLAVLSDAELAAHLADLVGQTEGENGWRISEIDPGFFTGLRSHILGYRVRIESFDCIAKFSQDKSDADIAGIIAGLCRRGRGQDRSVAELVGSLAGITG